MEKQNITLSLPKEIILKIKHIAIDRNTSISGLITQAMVEIVDKEERYQTAKSRQQMVMERGLDLGELADAWKREDLHER